MTESERLGEVSGALKQLHRALIRAELGDDPTLDGPYSQLFALVNDPRFAWMNVLSRLIVEIDETLEDEGAASLAVLSALRARAAALIGEEEAPDLDEFRLKRLVAVQRDPDVGLATGGLRAALSAKV